MFKKIFCFMAVISLLFVAGCGKEEEAAKKQKNKPEVTQQPAETPELQADGWTSELCEIPLNAEENADKAEDICEIGNNEYDIRITLSDAEDGEHFEKINVSVNGAECSIDSLGCYEIASAAAAELDGKNLMIFTATTGEDGWSVLTAVRYDGEDIKTLTFEESEVNNVFLPLSHFWNGEITLTDGSSFEIWRKTTSLGMWETKRICTLEGDKITELKQDKYETNTKEFLTPRFDYDENMFESREEYDRLSDGYVLCRQTYDILKEGEYFTMLYDDGNNTIYVKTESGEEGWIAIPDDYSGYEIAPMLLYLAG